ncbi:MAG: MBL fold metallo-hydrolase [Frankia sp.]
MVPATFEAPDDWTEPGAYLVADGVYRIPLPLPNDGLRAVNVYAIVQDPPPGSADTGPGLVLVDGGWTLEESEQALVKALGTFGAGLVDIRRFLVTHAHRDHYTQAVAIRRRFGSRVALGLNEKATVERFADPGRRALNAQIAQLTRCGAGELGALLKANAPAPPTGKNDWEMPDEWLDGPTRIDLGDRTLAGVPTPGHTKGHFVFIDDSAGLMFSGDHVLPHITPSIGLEAAPAALPLGSFLDSLRLVRSMPDRRMLPAHGPASPSVHARVDELLEHHRLRLDATEAVVQAGSDTAYAVAKILRWTRRERRFADLDLFNQVLATSETGAHLDLLAAQGRLRRRQDDDIVRYDPA